MKSLKALLVAFLAFGVLLAAAPAAQAHPRSLGGARGWAHHGPRVIGPRGFGHPAYGWRGREWRGGEWRGREWAIHHPYRAGLVRR